MLSARPNLALNSDPACIAWRSFSWFGFLGSAHRLGAGGAGNLLSLGLVRLPLAVGCLSVVAFQLRPFGRFHRKLRRALILRIY